MNKDNDPIMSDMKPSADEIAQRQRQMQARKAAAARSGGASKRPTSAAQAPAAGKQTLAMIALVLAVIVGALAGLLFTQLQTVQQKLERAEGVIVSQADNIDVLNEKLSVTGENANMSVDALKTSADEHDSEIRKLWHLSNQRNRPAIAANKKAVAAVKSTASKAQSGVSAQKKKTAALEKQIDTELAEIKERLEKVEFSTKSLAEIELRISQQNESIQSLQANIAELKKSGLGQDAADIQLQLEDIGIRLDRMQNAMAQ